MSDSTDTTRGRTDVANARTLDLRLARVRDELRQRQDLYDRLSAQLTADEFERGFATLLVNADGIIEQASDDAIEVLASGNVVGQPLADILRVEDGAGADVPLVSAGTLVNRSDEHLICADSTLEDGRHLLVLTQTGAADPVAMSATQMGTAYRTTLHDLSNVFASILGYAELALMTDEADRARRFVNEVYEAGKRGQEVVQEAQMRLYRAGVRERPALEQDGEMSPARILVVDDDPTIAGHLCDMLFSAGYHVEGMTDSREALVMFNEDPQSFDLAIVDQNMPGMRGTDLLREFMAVRDDLPVVICTGSGDTLRSVGDGLLQVHSLVTKPVERETFLDLVAAIVAERHGVRH